MTEILRNKDYYFDFSEEFHLRWEHTPHSRENYAELYALVALKKFPEIFQEAMKKIQPTLMEKIKQAAKSHEFAEYLD